jgi:putative addiction module component (TIGR02574 family)
VSIAELQKLPPSEKLRIIEALWGELATEDGAFNSPAWHAEPLRQTAAEWESGALTALEWSEAKAELRRRFS